MLTWGLTEYLSPARDPYGIVAAKFSNLDREFGNVSFDNVRNASESYNCPELSENGEFPKEEDTYERDDEEELSRLAACVNETRRKVCLLWSSIQSFRKSQVHCRDRHFDHRYLGPRSRIWLMLDSQAFDSALESGGELEHALDQAEEFLDNPIRGFDSIYPRPTSLRYLLRPIIALQAQIRLEELSAYESRLEMEYRTVRLQQSQVRFLEIISDEEERQRREKQHLYDIYLEHFGNQIRGVVDRLRLFLQFLLIPCKTPKFPDGDEPMCTTMPWNILPALAVLWGMCWMFYSSPGHVDQTESQLASSDCNIGASSMNWTQWFNDGSFWLAGSEIAQADFNIFAEQLPGVEWNGDPTVSTTAAMSGHQGQVLEAAAFAQTGYQLHSGYGAESSSQDVARRCVPASNGAPQPTFQSTGGPPSVSTLGQTETIITEPGPSVIPSLHSPIAQATQLRSASPSERVQSDHRSSESDITCEYTQCSGMRFNKISDWKKHNNRIHNRNNCVVSGCTKSFGSKGDLFRHKQTKHNQLPLHKRLRCPILGCKFARTLHFKRKDNLTNHLKNKHSFNQADAKARADSQARLQARSGPDYQPEPQPAAAASPPHASPVTSTPDHIPSVDAEATPNQDMCMLQTDTAVPGPSKRRRLSGVNSAQAETSTAASTEAPCNQPEMWETREFNHEEEKRAMQAQNAALQTENQVLKSEIDRLKRNEESLIAALLAATQRS